jgi:hypothetical protein
MPVNTSLMLTSKDRVSELIAKELKIPAIAVVNGDLGTAIVTEDEMINQIQKLDSIHDFGGSRGSNIACDAISLDRTTGKYIFNSMRMSYIQKYSFENPQIPSIINIPIINFSALSYPGVASQQRAVDDIENYCVLLSMKKKIVSSPGANNDAKYDKCFMRLPMPDTAILTLKKLKSDISNFFSGYKDDDTTGTGKINFIVDTPGDVSKILKSDPTNNKFAYILTQESAHDSASSKSSSLSPLSITQCYQNNGYIEVVNFDNTKVYKYKNGAMGTTQPKITDEKTMITDSISRKYSNNNDDTVLNNGKFESHFEIKFTGMGFEVENKKEYFYTSVQYNTLPVLKCKLNQKPHPTNVNTIVKEIKSINTAKVFLKSPEELLLKSNKKNKFYNEFNKPSNYNLIPTDKIKLDYSFTKKRAGDGLQAKVVKLVNSGKLLLYCHKQNLGGPALTDNLRTAGGTNTEIIYKIQRLVLVTIDRVLFSYCVKNDIPVILTGDKYLLLFKPADLPTQLGGDSKQNLSIKNNINYKMNNDDFNNKKSNIISKKNNQKGGESINELIDLIKSIPYVFLKTLPHLLMKNRQTFSVGLTKIRELKDFIILNDTAGTIFSALRGDESCVYIIDPDNPANNGKVHIPRKYGGEVKNNLQIDGVDQYPDGVDYQYGYCDFGTQKFLIYTNKYKVKKDHDNFYYITKSTETLISPGVIKGFIDGRISSDHEELITCYNIRNKPDVDKNLFDIFMEIIDSEYNPELLDEEQDEEYVPVPEQLPGVDEDAVDEDDMDDEVAGGTIINNNTQQMSVENQQMSVENPQMSVENQQMSVENQQMSVSGTENLNENTFLVAEIMYLNPYLQFFYNTNISLDENLLVTNNYIAMISYLSLFNSYEMNMCWDNDQYDQDFKIIKGLEVTNKISMYLLFFYLLNDFYEQKDKICYGLLEYFIHPSINENYFIIEDDLSSLIYYVTCSYINLPLSVNQRIKKMIDIGEIDKNSEIFIKTENYFISLIDRINNHNELISEYLYSENSENSENSEMVDFIKYNLNMYGFMMMIERFYRNINNDNSENAMSIDEKEKIKKMTTINETKSKFGGLKITKIKNRRKRAIKRTKKIRKQKTKKNKKPKKQKTKKIKK